MAIVDAFLYNGEIDILKLRMNVLSPHVDLFVIVEAKRTFSGNKKPLFFLKQEARVKKFWKRIKYHVIDEHWKKEDLALLKSSLHTTGGLPHWETEFLHKEAVKIPLRGLSDGDLCFIGDVDEIWNPHVLEFPFKPLVYQLRQKVYTYYLNLRSDERWEGTFVAPYSIVKNACINHLRTERQGIHLDNGGWHFTNMGGLEKLRYKIESYGHQEFNTPEIKGQLPDAMQQGRDYIGRDFHLWVDESEWPSYLTNHRKSFEKLLKPVGGTIEGG